MPVDISEAHLGFEFQDPTAIIGAWGADRRNQKIRVFWKNGYISNLVTGENTKHK